MTFYIPRGAQSGRSRGTVGRARDAELAPAVLLYARARTRCLENARTRTTAP